MTPTWLGSGNTSFFDRGHPGDGEARGSSSVVGVVGRALPAKLATSASSVVRVRGVIFGLSGNVSRGSRYGTAEMLRSRQDGNRFVTECGDGTKLVVLVALVMAW